MNNYNLFQSLMETVCIWNEIILLFYFENSVKMLFFLFVLFCCFFFFYSKLILLTYVAGFYLIISNRKKETHHMLSLPLENKCCCKTNINKYKLKSFLIPIFTAFLNTLFQCRKCWLSFHFEIMSVLHRHLDMFGQIGF